MTEINATGSYAGPAPTRTDAAEAGMVRLGSITLSATDAAEFVMLHRTEVMKKVGADRTEMAQQHLTRIKKARQVLSDLIDLKKFSDAAGSYKGRVPVTPQILSFLKDVVGCSPGESTDRVVYDAGGVSSLPASVRDYYGFDNDGHGTGGEFTISSDEKKSTHNRYQIHFPTILYHDSLDSLKEEVNNYIDQQNDSNNLFMTKFKSVVSSMNEAFEGANSMADKSHDTLKSLLSRW